MKRSILIDLLKLLAVFSVIFAILYFLPIFPDKDKLTISIEKEEKLGKLIVEDLLSNNPDFHEIDNHYVDSAIFVIKERLIKVIEPTDFDYKIKVIKDPVANAYALPGGYIFIHSGLIKISENPEEVAGVLAHEMGHIEHRHVISRLIKELGIAIVTSGDASIIGELGRTAVSTVFDRNQEKEADDFALKTLYDAEISPRHLGIFFRRMRSEYGSINENMEILSTHPHINSRIKSSFEYEINNDFKESKIDLDWNRVKESI